jgi:putative FmdB family regulatory protein|tara:strand:- start:2481 stop:2753 length:273 start_codon:yes stop_codon:yes gene_type:complete
MPRYLYECENCGETETVIHGIDEVHSACSACQSIDCMQKLFTNSFAIKKATTNLQGNETVGELTKQYIEENRVILKEEQKKALKETHEPS